MDPFMELTIEMTLLTQQLRTRHMANERHMSMSHVQYGGTPYLNNYNFGWDHHPSLLWENTLHFPQVQRSNLEATMTELAKVRAKMENSRAQIVKSSLEDNMAD